MNILYDNIIFNLQKSGGISTYWRELIPRLLKTNFDVQFFEKSNNKNIVRQTLAIDQKLIINDRSFRLLPLNLRNFKKPFIFHSSYYRVCRNPNSINVVTIHDFVHEKFYTGLRRYLHILQKNRAIKNANLIITVSENTKKDLLFYYPEINSDNIKVIYNGVSDDFFQLKDNRQSKLDSLLYVGSREKYKNFDNIIKVISQFKNFNIVIVGPKLNKHEIVFLNTYLKGRWTLYLNISNQELNILYNSVFALLYVSSYEGFGIPMLEAMKAGCPFIALNNSSIPEVAGNAGTLINDLNFNEINSAINYIKINREFIIKQGLIQVKFFSWEKCFVETLNLYMKYIDIK